MRKILKKKNKLFCLFIVLLSLLQPYTALATASPSAEATPDPSASSSPAATQSATPPASPTPNEAYEGVILKLGDKNDQVISLQMRLRDLGYFTFKIGEYFGAYTRDSVVQFQKDNNLDPDGVVGGKTATLLYSNHAKRKYTNNRIVTPTPRPTAKPKAKIYGKLVEWSTAKNFVAWSGGSKFECIDFNTGKTYYLIRVGGTNHMDVEPATAKDTATLKSCYGGRWSWDRRPTVVKFKGTWYAASINGWPHGKETVRNNDMTGQICLHFLNSRTHGTGIKDSAHQRCVKRAAGK